MVVNPVPDIDEVEPDEPFSVAEVEPAPPSPTVTVIDVPTSTV
jgi:hypothetical protein